MSSMTDRVIECYENCEKEVVAFGNCILEGIWDSD